MYTQHPPFLISFTINKYINKVEIILDRNFVWIGETEKGFCCQESHYPRKVNVTFNVIKYPKLAKNKLRDNPVLVKDDVIDENSIYFETHENSMEIILIKAIM